MYMHQNKLNRIETLSNADATLARSKLKQLRDAILARFPDAQFASDQAYRDYDLAVDFCEDVAPWPETRIQELVRFCEEQGAIAKISSIHVNTWFGKYTKLQGIQKWLEFASANVDSKYPKSLSELIFVGDSPNDEPLFEAFPYSVGVANVKRFLPNMKHPPRWMTHAPMGAGFAELAKLLLS